MLVTYIFTYIQKVFSKRSFFGAFVFVFCFLLPHVSFAARISISPSVLNLSPGQTGTFYVTVNSTDQAMNAVSGTLTIPKDLLDVTGVSKTGSIISLWVAEPTFSQSAGTVSFEGVVLNPGYTGASGRVIAVTVRAKGAGSGATSFVSASVLANDGNGTNILTDLGTASITVSPQTTDENPPVTTTQSARGGVPPAVPITSSTHPDPDLWYNLNTATFSWDNPSGITGVNVLADKKATSNPGTSSDGLFETYTYKELEDGVWYVHLRLRNASGWGGISHRRFQVDTTNPENLIIRQPLVQTSDAHSRQFIFEARDSLSGIKEFLVRLDNGPETRVEPQTATGTARTGVYSYPNLSAGNHVLFVKAVDQAGNSTADSLAITVSEIEPPSITEYTDTLSPGELFSVRGSASPKATVKVFLRDKENETVLTETVPVLDTGNFFYVANKTLSSGEYYLSAQTELRDGGKSAETKALSVRVRRNWFMLFSQNSIIILSTIIPALALIFLLAFLLEHTLKRVKRAKKHLRKIEMTTEQAFDLVRDEVRKQIENLEGVSRIRDLTAEEQRLLKHLGSVIDQAEEAVEKEITFIKRS